MSRRIDLTAQLRSEKTLSDGATINWSLGATGTTAQVTLGGNRTMATPTGGRTGQIYVLRVIQDGTGGRTLSWNSAYVFPQSGPPILSTGANAVDTFIFVWDGSSAYCIAPQKRGSMPRGYIDGLIMSNDTDTAHDISVSAGEATLVESTTGETATLAVNAGAFVKQIDANWAEGTASGGFPSGLSLSDTTWYHYFIIAKTDGQVDFGFDTSLTATNLLSDASSYSFYRRIGSVLTFDSGGSNFDITAFLQLGDIFLWSDPPEDAALTNATGGLITLSVPTGVSVNSLLNINVDGGDAYIFHPDVTTETADPGASPTAPFGFEGGGSGRGQQIEVPTDTSSQIEYNDDGGGTLDLNVATLGWIDPRGRAKS